MFSTFIIQNNPTNFNTKPYFLNHKFLIKPISIWFSILWGNTKKSNLNRIQSFQNIALSKLIDARLPTSLILQFI